MNDHPTLEGLPPKPPGAPTRVASPRERRSLRVICGAGLLLSLACSTKDPVPGPGAPGSGTPGSGSGGSSSGTVEPGDLAEPVECGPRPTPTPGDFTKAALLTAAADCASWHYCQFDTLAFSLDAALQAHVAGNNDATLAAARGAWRDAMLGWARAELFQFGPAGSRAYDPYHGASFRDRIYSWPSASRCRVEEQIISQAYLNDFDQVLVSGKGLFALEYLLFYVDPDTACSATSATASAWASLDVSELERRKREYALAVSRNVLSLARELGSIWSPSGGGFRQTFIDAVGYERPGTDADQEALNIVAWSLVYAEKEVKDWKIGPFTGKVLPPAPIDGFEAPYAGIGQELVVANLEGLQSAYQGCGDAGAGVGFDDWLTAANHAELALDLDAALQGALAQARAFPAFQAATEAEFARLYDEGIKPLTDLLKNELLAGNGSALNLSLPASAAADND
jgi:predicted lipoprotein